MPFFIIGTNRMLDAVVRELRLLHSTMLTFAQRRADRRVYPELSVVRPGQDASLVMSLESVGWLRLSR